MLPIDRATEWPLVSARLHGIFCALNSFHRSRVETLKCFGVREFTGAGIETWLRQWGLESSIGVRASERAA